MFLRNYKIIFFSLLIVLSFALAAQAVEGDWLPASNGAGANKAAAGLDKTATEGYGKLPAETNPSAIIGKVVGSILAFLGIAFFILMIFGGFTWMFSMGNEQAVGKAKDILIAAVIGLIIVLMAYVIVTMVTNIFPDITK